MSYTPAEDVAIAAMALKHGIDWRLLKALRQTENGGPGREFGVLDGNAKDWTQQADEAARTIRHTVGRSWKWLNADAWDDVGGMYTISFLSYFSRGGIGYAGYAPLGAANDPSGLNANHLHNLTSYYFGAAHA